MDKVVAVIPARNEEQYISKTLEALVNQTVEIESIIVVNDGSTDQTKEVANSFPKVKVIDRPDRGYGAVGKAILAETFNSGFKQVELSVPDYRYVLVVGADTVLPSNYVERLLLEFGRNENLVMASGIIVNESFRPGAKPEVRGTGRMIKREFWEQIGSAYPVKVGWESYPVFKARQMGFEAYAIPDLIMELQRPTGKKTDYGAYGEAMRALGYFWPLALGRSLRKKNPKVIWQMAKGYFKGKERYEQDLRKFVNSSQKRRLRKLILRF